MIIQMMFYQPFSKEITMYDKKVLIAVSIAVVIGLLGLAPQANADNVDQQEAATSHTEKTSPLPWWWNEGRGSFAYPNRSSITNSNNTSFAPL
jgi:hypothetical protein